MYKCFEADSGRGFGENQDASVAVFDNPDFGQIRVVMRGDVPWFYASDVATALGYSRPADAVNAHCKKTCKINQYCKSPNRPPVSVNVIPESDVFRLAMRSCLPSAERFQDWVCEEVLPSIRKTGSYGPAPKATALEAVAELLSNPRALGQLLIDYADTKEQLALETARANEAVRTKAEIGSRREATAMATASAAVRQNTKLTEANAVLTAENADLKDERGKGENFKAATNIPWIKSFFDVTLKGAWSQIGKALSKVTKALGLEARKVAGEKYDVKAYPLQAVEEFRRQVETDDTLLQKYRLS